MVATSKNFRTKRKRHRETSAVSAALRAQRLLETYPVAAPGIPANTTKNLYYSTSGQVLEERWNGTASSDTQYQYVWSATYVNAMVLRDTFTAGTIQPELRVYTTYDANYNVTSLITYDAATQTWGVSERFVYSPYGSELTFDANYNAIPDALNWQYMYQGGRFDTATGLYHFGARNYSPSLGIWISQDPLQYVDGANTYQMEMSAPVGRTDPQGTVSKPGINVAPEPGWPRWTDPQLRSRPVPTVLRRFPPGYNSLPPGWQGPLPPNGPQPSTPCAREKWEQAMLEFRYSVDHGWAQYWQHQMAADASNWGSLYVAQSSADQYGLKATQDSARMADLALTMTSDCGPKVCKRPQPPSSDSGYNLDLGVEAGSGALEIYTEYLYWFPWAVGG